MTVADLITELQKMPQHLPVRTTIDMIHLEGELGEEWDEYFGEEYAQPVDTVGVRGAYVLIEGAE